MAVPKKRTFKMKKRSRKSNWTQKAALNSKRSFALSKSLLTGKLTSFVYILDNN